MKTPPHYDMKIEPVDFILENKLGFCEANAIKYLCRWKKKNGVEDLRKAIHYIEMLIDRQEPVNIVSERDEPIFVDIKSAMLYDGVISSDYLTFDL